MWNRTVGLVVKAYPLRAADLDFAVDLFLGRFIPVTD